MFTCSTSRQQNRKKQRGDDVSVEEQKTKNNEALYSTKGSGGCTLFYSKFLSDIAVGEKAT